MFNNPSSSFRYLARARMVPDYRYPIIEDARLLDILGRLQPISHQVNSHGRFIRDLSMGKIDISDKELFNKGRVKRGDATFEAYKEAQAVLKELASMPETPESAILARAATLLSDRAVRYNRESGVYLERSPVSIIPAEYNRHFRRDDKEEMYFLALHGLPTAYDFFCCTFTKTPQTYLQEKHLHCFSEELTLVLNGTCDCIWYDHEQTQNAASCTPRGRLKAGPLEAFRIPPKAVHTLHSSDGPNENITVKLSLFIDDRVGENQWQFGSTPKLVNPVTIDCGHHNSYSWGEQILFDHGFNGLKFSYEIIRINAGHEFQMQERSEKFLFVASGSVHVSSQNRGVAAQADRHQIIRIAPGESVQIRNNEKKSDAVLFSTRGLDYRHFLKSPQSYPQYPEWLTRDILWTLGELYQPYGIEAACALP